jgi:cytochrome P450
MVETVEKADTAALPLAPKNPLPYRRQVRALRAVHTGLEALRDAGGPVTRLKLAPRWLSPAVVVATSPQGARDILGRTGAEIDKTRSHDEFRYVLGPNLFDLRHEPWLPRRRALQPIFTKQHVREFGGHMAQAAEMTAATWRNGSEVDLNVECRKLTLRALGRSVLGLDLDEHTGAIAEPLRVATKYATDRGLRPLRAPRWLPTSARRRARAASAAPARVRQRDTAGLPNRSRPRGTSSPGAHRRDRPADRAGTIQRRSLRRARAVHARGSRHHFHRTDLRAVGARRPPRHCRTRSVPRSLRSAIGS